MMMIGRVSLESKYLLWLAVAAGCAMLLLVSISELVPAVAAQGPEEAEPIVPTEEFPDPSTFNPEMHYGQQCYDPYEPNDARWQATPLIPGTAQDHVFCYPWDRDVMRFSAKRAVPYVIGTSNLGPDTNTVLELYDGWGRRLTWDEDSAGGLASLIEWVAPYDGRFYVLARQRNPYVAGPEATYTIALDEFEPQCAAVGCKNYVLVDRGCGSYYGVGQYVRVYIFVEADGEYSLELTTDQGSRTVWSGFLQRGTYYLHGRTGWPTGPRTLTLHDGVLNPSCTFHVSGGWYGYGVKGQSIQGLEIMTPEDQLPEQLPAAELLEVPVEEW